MTTRHLAGLLVVTLAAPSLQAESTTERSPHAVVLMYHRFGEDRYPSTNIRLDQFDAQLELLDQGGFEVLPLGRIVAAITEGRPLPDRAVALTVDDAYRSVFDEAYPRLKARGWPFTVFVSTDAIDAAGSPQMTWAQMREMREHGVSFANHTATHESMAERREGEDDAARRARIREDVARAQRRLREELDEAPMWLAYPYGDYDAVSAALVAELGFTAFGQQSGPVGAGSDSRALPRFPMAEAFAGLEGLRDKLLSLPLPLEGADPWSPITPSSRPVLELTLGVTLADPTQLACYAGGQGRIDVRWLDPGRRLETQAKKELPPGRRRYNCTAPSGQSGRYYWYSHPWIVVTGDRR